MKVNELLEAHIPHYDEKTKFVKGPVKDWLIGMGASAEDLAKARKEAKKLESYENVYRICDDLTTEKEAKNGTFSFKHPNANDKTQSLFHVYPNGLIRSSALNSFDDRVPTRLKSPKPEFKDKDPVKRIVHLYDNAFKELYSKLKKIAPTAFLKVKE